MDEASDSGDAQQWYLIHAVDLKWVSRGLPMRWVLTDSGMELRVPGEILELMEMRVNR